jgi:hypothetical protein
LLEVEQLWDWGVGEGAGGTAPEFPAPGGGGTGVTSAQGVISPQSGLCSQPGAVQGPPCPCWEAQEPGALGRAGDGWWEETCSFASS